PAAEGERAIVVAAAGPEAHALGVKAHQRQEHHVQPARAEGLPRLRLGDPQAIALERAAHLDELHGARGAPPVDARQVDAAAAAARQRDERRGIDRKSTRLNSSHLGTSYAVFCLIKKIIDVVVIVVFMRYFVLLNRRWFVD